jgi:hypothetical protein
MRFDMTPPIISLPPIRLGAVTARITYPWFCSVVLLSAALSVSTVGCGEVPTDLGVLVNELQLEKRQIGVSPSELPSEGLHLLHREVVSGEDKEYRRVKEADVLGNEQQELLVELPRGKGLAVTDLKGAELAQIGTAAYLTDFGSIVGSRAPKRDLVLYEFPNRTRGATFRVITPDRAEVATWAEDRPPSHFDTGVWNGTPAVFYLRDGEIVIRSWRGEPLATRPVPTSLAFRQIHAREAYGGRLLVVASGDGYTPYHMVCVYDADGGLVFQEIASEHAFRLNVEPHTLAFTVWTRSAKWRYGGI